MAIGTQRPGAREKRSAVARRAQRSALLCLLALGPIAAWRLAAERAASAPPAVATVPRPDVAAVDLRAESSGTHREALAVDAGAAVPSDSPNDSPNDARSAVTPSPILVRVVRAGSGRPIPGAAVWTSDWSRVDLSTDAGLAAALEASSDIEQQLHAFGDVTTADARGHAWIPAPAARPELGMGCRDGEDFGYLHVDLLRDPPPADGVRLEVGVDTTLEVQTVDAAGRPLSGVPIGLRPCAADPSKAPARAQPVGATRAPDGVVLVRHLQHDGRYRADPPPAAFEACALVPGLDVTARTAGLPVGRQSLVLALPPTGSVRVRVRDPEGRPVPGRYAVWIRRAAQGEEERARMRREAIAAQTTTSEVTFAHVALHQEYTLWVSAPLPTSLVTVAGPTAEQPAIDVVLELSRESAIFTGRAVDETGAPLAERHLEFFASNGDAADSGRMRTDAQGNFLFAVKAVVLRRPLEALHLGLLEGRIRRTGIGADLSDLAPLVTGARALGDVVFSRQPVLAAGRITIDGIATDLRPDLWLEARRENGRWSGVGAALSWSEQGFELRGARPRGRLRLAARTEDHACAAAQEIECGAAGLVLDLRTGAARAPDED